MTGPVEDLVPIVPVGTATEALLGVGELMRRLAIVSHHGDPELGASVCMTISHMVGDALLQRDTARAHVEALHDVLGHTVHLLHALGHPRLARELQDAVARLAAEARRLTP